MRSYDLCNEKFYNNDDKKMQKTKNQSILTDRRPKLIPWKNSCRFCDTQMHATKECRRRNIFEVDKSTQFPPPVPPRNSSTFSRLFPLHSKKLLDLNSTTCKNPFLSKNNPTFLFQPSEKPNEFSLSTSIQSVFNFNSTPFLHSRKILHRFTIFSFFRDLF